MVRSLDPSAERLERVLDVLLQAGRALTNSQEIGAALSQIAEAVVCNFSDSCEIDVDGYPGGPDRVSASAGEAVAASGGGEIAEALTDGRKRYGTITCRASGSDFDDATRKAIKVLATELGIVLAGQATMRREHRIADRPQRTLLPGQLPVVPGVEFHAAYLPAGDEAEVGGDWFDAFDLPDRRIGISIGDVAGHGLEAAVIMGEVRQAIRTAAVGADCAATVLEHVNRIIGLGEPMDMATAIFGIYDPESSTLSYVSAGHPPPLIALANGLVRRLPSGGSLPLGCADTLEARDWTFTIPADAQVIFYTDGLIENERDLVAGEKQLAEAVHDLMLRRREFGMPLADQATALQQSIFSGHSNRDDAAILILSRTAPVESYLFSAVPVVATIARAIVGDELTTLGVEHERRFGILVALGEAIANAIEHAYHGAAPGLIRLKLEHDGRQVSLIVEDFGCWKPFVRGGDRGRGIELMHAIMDGVQIRSTRESTQIVLKADMEPS